MGPIGIPELVLIFVVALIFFGPKKLPDLGRSLGKSISEFKRASNELRNTLEEEVRLEDQKDRAKAALTSSVATPPSFTPDTNEADDSTPETIAPAGVAPATDPAHLADTTASHVVDDTVARGHHS